MGPQLEDGFTKIANKVLEDLIVARLTGPQYQLVLAVLRKTWGFCERKEDGTVKMDGDGQPVKLKTAPISIGEFMDMTGLSKGTVAANLGLLVEWRILTKETSKGGRPSRYGYQKYRHLWVVKLSGTPDSSEGLTVRDAGQFEESNCPGLRTVNCPGRRTDLNKIKKEGGGELEPKNLDELLKRYSPKDQELIREYWETIRRTRRRGRLADSIVRAMMDKWDAFPAHIVIQGLELHLDKYPGKREEYTHGIIRRLLREPPDKGGQPKREGRDVQDEQKDKKRAFIRSLYT